MLFALIIMASWLLNLKLFVSPTLTNIFCPQFSGKWDLRVPPFLVTVVLYRYDSKGKWYGSHCFTMEEALAQICTISGMVAALCNHVEVWPKQTAKFSFMDECGIMVPLTCDNQLIGLMKRYASARKFELNCDVLDVEAAATGSRPSILGQGGCSNPISS